MELVWSKPTRAGRKGTENRPKQDIFISLSFNFQRKHLRNQWSVLKRR